MKMTETTRLEVERMAAAINNNVERFWNHLQTYEEFSLKQAELWRESEEAGIYDELGYYLGKRIRPVF